MKIILIILLFCSYQSFANESPKTLICDYKKLATPDGLETVSKNEFKLTFIIDSKIGKVYSLGNNGSRSANDTFG